MYSNFFDVFAKNDKGRDMQTADRAIPAGVQRTAAVSGKSKVTGYAIWMAFIAAALLLILAHGAALKVHAAPAAPNCNIVYDFGGGRTYTVGPALAMTMMTTNPDGSYAIDPKTGYYYCDPAKMLSFFSGLQNMFPTAAGANTAGFQTTAGNYLAGYDASGFQQLNCIDVNTEINYLAKAIMEQRSERHVPAYRCGGTYIEIDKTNQTLYYYENGALRYTTPVVTGNVSHGSDTPSGIYTLRAKQTNVNLTGANYVSHVTYWMPFIRNSIGIHDASWRKSFGGQIYQTNGSHGCVNVPPANMPDLYNMVKVGTPVVVY